MKFMSPKSLSILVAALAIGIGLGVYVQPAVSGDSVFEQVRKFNDVLSMAVKNYVDEVDTQKLTEAAIRGMLDELDPHSVYITAKEMERVEEDFKGSFEGIGVEFDIISDTITIISPITGGPSEALGILAGDKIVRINDSVAVGLTRADVPKKLRGQKGTIVKVVIKRATRSRSILSMPPSSFRAPTSAISRPIASAQPRTTRSSRQPATYAPRA
jgi:carboxyl-terminal processing protease